MVHSKDLDLEPTHWKGVHSNISAVAHTDTMPRITVELLRKRSEHNEGIISTLEEISLHQEELEKIEVIGTLCRKLRILYLQNNIIEKIEDLTHMKELRYLNLALNNISAIEGLGACEFLNKLDLTVNFVDFDTLEASIVRLHHLSVSSAYKVLQLR